MSVFLSVLKTSEFADDIKTAEEAYQNLHGDILNLKGTIKPMSETFELNELLAKINQLSELLTCNFEEWRKNAETFAPVSVNMQANEAMTALLLSQLPDVDPAIR